MTYEIGDYEIGDYEIGDSHRTDLRPIQYGHFLPLALVRAVFSQSTAKSKLHLVDKLLTSERQTRVRRPPQFVVAKTG